MDDMVRLHRKLLRLAHYCRWVAARKGTWACGVSRERRKGRAEAYDTAARLLRAELEQAGIDTNQELPS